MTTRVFQFALSKIAAFSNLKKDYPLSNNIGKANGRAKSCY